MKPLDTKESKFTPHVVAGPDAHWPKSLTAIARVPAEDELALSLVDAGAEIDRLQRRVMELEAIALNLGAELQAAQKEASDNKEEWHAADDEAVAQRKRAEAAEARAETYRRAAEGIPLASEVADAIEKAQQEERERCIEAAELTDCGVLSGPEAAKVILDNLRALKSTKEPT